MLEVQHIDNFWETFLNLCTTIASNATAFVDTVIYWTTKPILTLFINEIGIDIGNLWFIVILPQPIRDFVSGILGQSLLSLMITGGISFTIAWIVLSAIFKLIDAINPT